MMSVTVRIALAGWVACLLGLAAAESHAAGAPQLSTAARQERQRVWTSSLLPLWDTTWWIDVNATPGSSPICRLRYSSRFTDGADARPMVGTWDITGGDAPTLKGRILVRCPARPDYERPLRVRLQAEACDGSRSSWQTVQFPVAWDTITPTPTVHASATEEAPPLIETVTTEASAGTTIEQVRAAIDQAARARGAERATGLRVVESRGGRTRFAADIVLVATPTAAPEPDIHATPTPREARVLGEILLAPSRR